MNRRVISTARRGLTITELVVALGMLSALGTLVAQWHVVAAAQQARESQQRLAVQLAENTMEQLYALPWQTLTQEEAAALAASALESAADYQSTVEISDVPLDDSGLKAKRIWLRVAHRKEHFPPVQLMAWRHAKAAAGREDAP